MGLSHLLISRIFFFFFKPANRGFIFFLSVAYLSVSTQEVGQQGPRDDVRASREPADTGQRGNTRMCSGSHSEPVFQEHRS